MSNSNVSVEQARQLTAIIREASSKSFQANIEARGAMSRWLLATSVTLHSGGLALLITQSEKINDIFLPGLAFLLGLIFSLLSGMAVLGFHSSEAMGDDSLQQLELEGFTEIYATKGEADSRSNIMDNIASILGFSSIACLFLAGISILFNLK